jgi:hypothetical protein
MWKWMLDWLGYIYLGMLILFLVGFYTTTPPAFQKFSFMVQVATALFLVFRFNPYRKEKQLTSVDRRIILYAAYFILLSSFTDYINLFMVQFQKIVTETTGQIMSRVYLK